MAADTSPRRAMPRAPSIAARGMSMIEMLVTIVLVSIGLLGLMGVLAQAKQFSSDAEDRGRAANLANEAATLMTMCHSVAISNATNACYGQYTAWILTLNQVNNPAGGLPAGTGTVTVPADGDTANTTAAGETEGLITITWQAPHKATTSTYSTTVMIP